MALSNFRNFSIAPRGPLPPHKFNAPRSTPPTAFNPLNAAIIPLHNTILIKLQRDCILLACTFGSDPCLGKVKQLPVIEHTLYC
jgi:hypothetical protein